jgi:hypothetical protein
MIWAPALERTSTRLEEASSGGGIPRLLGAAHARVRAKADLARAHALLVAALVARPGPSRARAQDLIEGAGALVTAVPSLWASHGYSPPDRAPAALAAALELRLVTHERTVLSGQATYALRVEDAEGPAAQMRRALLELGERSAEAESALCAITRAAFELAALLVRAAANIMAQGRADEAPEARTAALSEVLTTVVGEVSTKARADRRGVAVEDRAVGHYLRQALRLPMPTELLVNDLDEGDRGMLRKAWLELAALESVAAAGLDLELASTPRPARYKTLDTALAEGAADLISSARLLSRPAAFGHGHAWRFQRTALSRALELYINGLPTACDHVRGAHEIVWARLVRAVAATALIDLAATR